MSSYPITDYRYREQQEFLNHLAVRYGFFTYRPDYHAAPRDANTVLFYTLEDEKHNREVDRQPTKYSRSEAADRKKYSGIRIDEKYVYRDAFFSFQNTDVNGHYNTDYANNGSIGLSGPEWRDRLEGAIMLAFTRKRQNQYLAATGGVWEPRESDGTYNDYNREIIKFFRMRYGKAYLGSINFYGENRDGVVKCKFSVYEEYTGQDVHNFACTFVVPEKDEQLQEMIRIWNRPMQLPAEKADIEKITDRIEKIGGLHLIWY